MTKFLRRISLLFWLAIVILGSSTSYAQQGYTENLGQWNNQVRFKRDIAGATLYIKQGAISVLQYDEKAWAEVVQHGSHERKLFKSNRHTVQYHHYEIEFVGSNLEAYPEGLNPKSHYYNYFIGDDESQHQHHVKEFDDVVYKSLYNKIDLIVHSSGAGLKYDFVLNPGAKIEDIKIRYNHVNSVQQVGDSISITTSLGHIFENIPIAYSTINGERSTLECVYKIKDGLVQFIAPNYNSQNQLVIDPEVIFATYAGNSVDNFGFTATYDEAGHLYAGGIATGPDFVFNKNGRYPATTGAFDQTYNEGEIVGNYFFPCDISLSKYAPDGSTLIYATYLGGNSNEYPHSIVVDKLNQLIVFGTTFSVNYPTTTDAFQKFNNGESDLLITKFSADCSSLLGSSLIGGASKDGLNEESVLNFFYADNFRGEVIVDSNLLVYIASSTFSSDFPLKDPIQSNLKGRQEGLLIMMNPDFSKMLWGTYMGGSNGDALYSVDLDSSGKIYVSGGTKSADLQSATAKIGNKYKGGTADGFISILDPKTKTLVKTAYWGGSSYDQIFSLEIDFENKIYVVGQSMSDMPVIGKVYNNPKSGQFISKFDQNLDQVEFSTVFGTGKNAPDITINAFLVDECRKIFISGWGGETSNKSFSSTYRLPITKDAYQDTTDGSDFYLMVLSKQAKELLYGTFFGGNLTNDHVDGGTSRFDKKGVIYQSVCASCPNKQHPGSKISDFPTTKGAFAEKNISPRCSNASFKIAFGNLNRPPNLSDKLLHITALDTLFDTYYITDPDDDSLFVTLSPDSRLIGNLVQFKANSSALETWSQKIGVTALCEHIGDTLSIDVYAADKGCPATKDSFATIRIVVDPLPILSPPESICLKFVGENAVELSWDPLTYSKYFKKSTLYRIDPKNDTIAIASFDRQNGIIYRDDKVIVPKVNNYSYFVIVTNLCDVDGPKSIKVSSTKEFTSPIESTYLITATVNNENNVEVYWAPSTEEDFASYDVYKKFNSDKVQYEYLGSTFNRNDTVLTDKKAKVNEQSYCYVIVVNDDCGHVSDYSNPGCTIVLEGISKPFEHQLFWNEYSVWQNGVNDYELSRSVDTGSLRPITRTPFDWRYVQDTSFNYDWGGYWYRVKAFENQGGYDATSQSNKIYLIQPPLLHVPNAFTPNGDGLNELWGIVPVFVKEYHLQVFDRWGSRVYDSNDVKTDWDGFVKNVQTSNTVYIYTIRFTGWDRSVHHRKGTVTILK